MTYNFILDSINENGSMIHIVVSINLLLLSFKSQVFAIFLMAIEICTLTKRFQLCKLLAVVHLKKELRAKTAIAIIIILLEKNPLKIILLESILHSFIADVLNDEMESQMIKYVVLKKSIFSSTFGEQPTAHVSLCL